jgi:hypothetical protein
MREWGRSEMCTKFLLGILKQKDDSESLHVSGRMIWIMGLVVWIGFWGCHGFINTNATA